MRVITSTAYSDPIIPGATTVPPKTDIATGVSLPPVINYGNAPKPIEPIGPAVPISSEGSAATTTTAGSSTKKKILIIAGLYLAYQLFK